MIPGQGQGGVGFKAKAGNEVHDNVFHSAYKSIKYLAQLFIFRTTDPAVEVAVPARGPVTQDATC